MNVSRVDCDNNNMAESLFRYILNLAITSREFLNCVTLYVRVDYYLSWKTHLFICIQIETHINTLYVIIKKPFNMYFTYLCLKKNI